MGNWLFYIGEEIVRTEAGAEPPGEYPGATRVTVEDDATRYGPATHKIVRGEPVLKTAAERHWYQLPKNFEVAAAIAAELGNTDKTQVADYPVSDAERLRWRKYRQALRDLSGEPLAMIEAWPARPDNTDPIAQLRARTKQG